MGMNKNGERCKAEKLEQCEWCVYDVKGYFQLGNDAGQGRRQINECH